MRTTSIIAALACIFIFSGCATREAELVNLSKEHFRDTATIKDDSLDTVAIISTVKGFQERQGLVGVVWDDNFLRAFVDKKTGLTRIQLYQIIYYQGDSWRFYHTINYESPEGPQARPLVIIDRDVNCKFSRYGGCMYAEHVGLEVDEQFLRLIAAGYQPGQRTAWKFKFIAKSGNEYKDGLLPAEVAGFLDALDAYRGRNGLAVGSPVSTQYAIKAQTPYLTTPPPVATNLANQNRQANSITPDANSETAMVVRLLTDQGIPFVGDPVRFKQKGNLSYYEARGPKGNITQVVCESGGACRLRTIHD